MQFHLKSLCVLCGAWTGSGRAPFCSFCRTRLNEHQGFWEREVQGLKVYSLFRWDADSPPAFSALSERVKELQSEDLFDFLARAFLAQLPPSELKRGTLVVIPSSTGRTHSLQWARALGKYLGLPLDSGLELTEARRQPGLSREARFARQMRWNNESDSRNYRDVLFVDDVITTGATMKAARDAVNPSGSTIGLTLFSRELQHIPC